MKVLFDTDVVMDVLQKRQPYYHYSSRALNAVELGGVIGCFSAHAAGTIFYLVSRLTDEKTARRAIGWVLANMEIAPCDSSILQKAHESEMSDFEDAIATYAGVQAKCELIVTRNTKDFEKSVIPALTPQEFVERVLPASR